MGKIVGAVVAGFVALLVLILALNSFGSTPAGFVGILRDGGPLDSKQLRLDSDGNPIVLPQGSALQPVGLFSDVRMYPANQRFWSIDSDGGGDSNQKVEVVTRDGVKVGVEGTTFLSVNQDPKLLGEFDTKWGTKPVTTTDGSRATPSDGTDDAWFAFLASVMPNVTNNVYRQQLSGTYCADLVASCSLVQNRPAGAPAVDPSTSLSGIQDRAREAFQAQLDANLGGRYLIVDSVSVSKVTLNPEVDAAVSRAQQAFAQVSEANARVASAEADARAKVQAQIGYNACNVCGQIDVLRALPQGITVYAPGNGNIALPAGR